MFPPPALVPLVLSKFLAEHVKGQLRQLILVALCWIEALDSHSSQHVGRHSSAVPHHKRSHCECLSGPGAQGSAISAFNPLGLSVMFVMQTRVLFLSLSGSGGGNSSIYIKGLPALLEGMGRLECLTGSTI